MRTHTPEQQHGNKGKSHPKKGSPHYFGIIRTEYEQRALERQEREKKECLIVRRACDAFFDRRGININMPIEPPEWNTNLIESCFEGAPIMRLAH